LLISAKMATQRGLFVTRVTPFPWHDLPAHGSDASQTLRRLRAQAQASFDPRVALDAVSKLLVAELSVRVVQQHLAPPPVAHDALIIDRERQRFIAVEAGPHLAAAALARLLARPIRLQQTTPLDPALRGAWTALALEITRSAARLGTWSAQLGLPEALPAQGLSLDCEVVLDGKRHHLVLWIAITEASSPLDLAVPLSTQYPAGLLLDIPLIVGMALTPVGELLQLQPGDVWWTDRGWWIDHTLCGKGTLAGPLAGSGASVDVSHDRIVLRKDRTALEGGMNQARGVNMNGNVTKTEEAQPLAQTLAELPIEVRVELGSITLPAAEWAQLQAGDVIPFGPMPSPVRLRANGKIIAEGELVRVDNALGVRVTSVSPMKSP
jgi:flagellar motor switch/type III secretory pathway protein FliN